MTQDLLRDAEDRMTKSREVLRRELAGIRTGRASAGLVEDLTVDYHGTPMPLKQLATITTPEPRLILIQPWDRGAIAPIERAILKSDLSLSPSNDGVTLRLNIPALTEERRKELARLVRQRVEQDRVAIRNIRRSDLERLRKMQKEGELSQDEERRYQDQLQKLTDRMLGEVDKLGAMKEAEVMEK